MGRRRTAPNDPTRVEVSRPRPASDVFTVNASAAVKTAQQAPGQPFGRYTLLKRLASGGMGEVFLAKQGGHGGFAKVVAIKRILSHYKEDDEHVRMFFDEAKLQALLSDRHIVQIYDMGEIDDHLFIAMEYVHGVSWRKLLERVEERGVNIHPAHAVDLAVQVARGLSYAHNVKGSHGEPLNVVHRDINPQNIIVSFDGEVKIIDFGIAKSDINDVHTTTGTLKGKFAYMSPEQGSGEKLDRRSDIFSFGICLWELLGGRNPFKRGNVVASLAAIQGEPHEKIGRLRKECRPFDAILDKALAKEADRRYDDCSEIAEALVELYANGQVDEPSKPLAAWLQELFVDEIEDHQALLDRMGLGQGLSRRGDTSTPHTASPYGMRAETSDPRRRRAAQLHDAPTKVLPDEPMALPSVTAPGRPPILDELHGFDEHTAQASAPLVSDPGALGPVSLASSEYVALASTNDNIVPLDADDALEASGPRPRKTDTDPTVSRPTSVEALSTSQPVVPAPAPARGRSLMWGTAFGLFLGLVAVLGLLWLASGDDDVAVAQAPVDDDSTPTAAEGNAAVAAPAPGGEEANEAAATGAAVAPVEQAQQAPEDEATGDERAPADKPDDGASADDASEASGTRVATRSPGRKTSRRGSGPADKTEKTKKTKKTKKTDKTDKTEANDTRASKDASAKPAGNSDRTRQDQTDDDNTKIATADASKDAKPAKRAVASPPPAAKADKATQAPPQKAAAAKLDARAPDGYSLSGGSPRRRFALGNRPLTVKLSGPADGHSFSLKLKATSDGAEVTTPDRACTTILRVNGAGVRCGGTFTLTYNQRAVLQVASKGKPRIEVVLKLSPP